MRTAKRTIDSFGGFLTIGAILVAVVVVAAILVTNRPHATSTQASTAPLLGEPADAGDVTSGQPHVSDPSALHITPGEPPTAGPHFLVPQPAGVYQQPVPDGNAIHSLEHGMVWISYNPEQVDASAVERIEEIGKQYGADVLVSPHPDNSMPIAVASWGRLLRLDAFDQGAIEEFIETNRNRLPEPFVR